MHVGVAQANTRIYKERPVRPLVSSVVEVRVGCRRRGMLYPLAQSSLCVYCGGGRSTTLYVDSGKYSVIDDKAGACRYADARLVHAA